MSEIGIGVDFLPLKAETAGIYPTGEHTAKEYIDGSAEMAYNFAINSRLFAAVDAERITNSAFLERFRVWVKTSGASPEMPVGVKFISININNAVFLQRDTNGNIVYNIEMELRYYRG
jgi:hypothetical protein